MTFAINTARLLAELDHLASFTDCPTHPDPSLPLPLRAVTRIVFTERDIEARSWFKGLVNTAGFRLREDAVGNTFVRWQGTQPELPAIGTGSHIDAIPHAGMFDGTVGVLGGLEAMRALQESGFVPRRSIELVLFTSEEPTRFGIGCLGSRLLAGVLNPTAADSLPDRLNETDHDAPGGGTLADARRTAGFSGSLEEVSLEHGHYAAWLELHIEQGPLLEQSGTDLGIVTHIAGPASYRFTVQGLGGHAGALLMPDRRDALCAAAEIVLAVERLVLEANHAAGSGNNSVATVGKLDVFPGNANAVPSGVVFSLDIRDTDAATRERILEQLGAAVQELTARRGVRIEMETINADQPTTCDPQLVDLLLRTALEQGASVRKLVSRAYHDTSFMARIAPVAMLFIPCWGGVSHRPDEYTAPHAIELGTRILAASLAALAA